MNQFFTNPSIILDAELLNENQRKKLEDLGYIKNVCFYGDGYDSHPCICWTKQFDEDIDIGEWEDENLPFKFEQQNV